MRARSVAVVAEQMLAPVPGGTGRYTADLLASLVATSPEGAVVTSWTAWHRRLQPATVAGVTGPRRLALGARALALAWERGLGPRPRHAQVVHATTLLAPPRGARPLVVTVHDAVPWTHPETLTPRGVAFHRRMGARVAAQADLIVVPSQATARALAGVLPLREGRLRVVPPGLAAAPQLPQSVDADERAARIGLPAGGYLVTLATLEPRKALPVLLAALARPEAPDLPLLVVGPAGWGGVDPHVAATGSGLAAGRVRWLGRLPDPDVAVVLSRAVALVMPSLAEGFGLPVLEGMALGTPVVTSDDPALLELGGAATRSAPRGDAAALAAVLADVVADPGEQMRMSADGLQRALDFDAAASGRALWAAYEELLR